MSHNIQYDDVRFDANRKEVESRINQYVATATRMEGGHGLSSPIRWLDSVTVQPDREAAEKKIKELDKGWYDSLAVRYYEVSSNIEDSPRLVELKRKSNLAYTKWNELDTKYHFADVKSKYISCPCCGSKLSVEHLETAIAGKNHCPLCHTDLRPKSTLDRIDALKKAWCEAGKKVNAERKALTAKNKQVRWLIKYEYHT